MAGVRLEHIFKKYPGADKATVIDVNLDIADKEFLVLVGPSGCGKSTTLRMIAGLEEITEGKLYIGDRVVNDVAPKDRDIAMVFQSYALYPHMNVYQNMAFGLKLRKVKKKKSTNVYARQQEFSISSTCLTANRRLSPVVSVNGLPWDAQLSAIRKSSSWTNRFPTWMLSSAVKCVRKLRSSLNVLKRLVFM